MTTLKDHFHLTRDIFTIDPGNPLDARAYFGREQVDQRILDRVQMDFVTRGVPKFFIFGRYGAGKTHTLAHIRHLLTSNQSGYFPATAPLLTSLPPLRSKDSWVKVHEHLMDEIGRSRVKDAVVALVNKGTYRDPVEAIRAEGVLLHGDTSLQESQAQIFRALIYKGVQETKAWEWLKGKALSSDDAAMLETQTNLTTVPNYIDALLNVACLIERGLGERLILLIDEAEVVGNIQNRDSIEEYRHAIRELASDRNSQLGFVIAFQMESNNLSESEVFSYEAIRRRIGFESGYIDLHDLVLDERDAKDFIFRVLQHLVDQDAAASEIEEAGLDTDAAAFPFTPVAIDRIAEFVTDDPDRKSPSQIITRMQQAVAKALIRDRESGEVALIDDDLVEEILHPDDA